MIAHTESADDTLISAEKVGSATLTIAPLMTEADTPNATAIIAHSRRGMSRPFH